MTPNPQDLFRAYLKARLERAEQRMDLSETDGEFEANRQVVIALKAMLEPIGRRAA